MKGIISIFWFCAFLLPVLRVAGQTTTIENLKRDIQKSVTVEQRLQGILFLCDQGQSLPPDTLMAYAIQAKLLAKKQKKLPDEVKAMYYISFALTNKGLIDSSLTIADRCLEYLSSTVNDPLLKLHVLNQRGRCFMRKNQYKEAIEMGYQVIAGAEIQKSVLLQMKGKTLIGWAYLEMGQASEALKWHLAALHTTGDTLQLQRYSILFANLALNYNGLGKTDSGFYYISRAITYSRKNEDLFALSNSLAIQAQLFVRSGQTALAEAPLKEVIVIRKQIGDPFYVVSDMAQLGLYYAHNGSPDKGIAICIEGIAMARDFGIDTKLFFLYSTLAENYKAAGNIPAYIQVLENIISLKDSVYQNNSAQALAEMQTRYDTQKKENTIIRQNLSLVKKNFLLYGSGLLFLIVVVAAWFLFRGYRRRQHLHMQFMREEEKRLSLQAIIHAEENERRRIATDLHDNLGAYAASIASNIDHLSIGEENENNSTALRELRKNSQAIVSQLSDSIWAMKKNALSLTAISDRLKVFINQIRQSYPGICIGVREQITRDHLLPSLQAFHLYRVLQEAVSNALKHSHAANITVSITGNNSTWNVAVMDDGKGMNGVKPAVPSGQGLENMKTRCIESGWDIHWNKGEAGGTLVEINPTTN